MAHLAVQSPDVDEPEVERERRLHADSLPEMPVTTDDAPERGGRAPSLRRLAASVGLTEQAVQPRADRYRMWATRRLKDACCAGLLLLALPGALQGCASAGYYAHLFAGQFEIWRDREPIDAVLDRGTLPPAVAARLAYAVRARDFAFEQLALPDNGSFRDYVDLGREFVIWNVFATPELSLVPKQSCYPFAGCFAYRGFFTEERARRYAEVLRGDGFDVFVGGVSAYSTLGWLNDPVLSSILNRDESRIAETIFHELAHELLYVPGDTAFNESFAMTVATAGLERWLPLQGGDFGAIKASQRREAQFIELLLSAREELDQHFQSSATPEAKRAAKQEAFSRLRADYGILRTSWSGDTSYDAWMETDLNNAKLASVSTYHVYVEAFMSILAGYDNDLPAFYQSVGRLAGLPPRARTACLNALTAGREPGEGICSGVLRWTGR